MGAAMQGSSVVFFVRFLSFLLSSPIIISGYAKEIEKLSVTDFGAVNHANTDSSEAFLKAWNAACGKESQTVSLMVPENQIFLVHPVVFKGPCKPKQITFLIQGKIVAPDTTKAWEGIDQGRWLVFNGVDGLTVTGSGEINGRGSCWWDQSCRYHPELKHCTSLAPTALTFQTCNALSLTGIRLTNSSQTHVLITGVTDVLMEGLKIQAPEHSPNTDGIHIDSARNVVIRNNNIGTGDDCVSIGDRIKNITVENSQCGPGHGVSIGSLGRSGNLVQVENIKVSNVSFKGTTNGARIKTWQVGRGYVRGITFENLYFDSVENPIIIDQSYCDVRGACKDLPTGVHISDVTYKNLQGSSMTEAAISLNCSRAVPCTNLLLESIRLTSTKIGLAYIKAVREVTSNCINAHGKAVGIVQPPAPCLLN